MKYLQNITNLYTGKATYDISILLEEIRRWLINYVGDYGISWEWVLLPVVDTLGHYERVGAISFAREIDAMAFRLRFGI